MKKILCGYLCVLKNQREINNSRCSFEIRLGVSWECLVPNYLATLSLKAFKFASCSYPFHFVENGLTKRNYIQNLKVCPISGKTSVKERRRYLTYFIDIISKVASSSVAIQRVCHNVSFFNLLPLEFYHSSTGHYKKSLKLQLIK